MAVEKEQTKQFFFGNSLAREFVLPFSVPETPVGKKYIYLELSDADGENAESIETNYEITRDESGLVTVRYPLSGEPMPSGKKLTVYRMLPLQQLTELPNGGAYNGETVEAAFDWSVYLAQQLQEQIARAVKIPITSEETPESVVGDIYTARDAAADSATAAALSATDAKQSADKAKGSEVVAEDARERACACADRAEEARDVAIGQAQATNLLMETEVAKINTIIGTDADARRLALEMARRWAEQEPGVPVDMDDDGNPKYSARHWANEASEISIPAASSTQHGGVILSDALDGARKADEGVAASEWALGQAYAHAVPTGGIIMWSGAIDDIPKGWALCNGENGTPNMVDRFIVGAGGSYAAGATGGATTHNHGGAAGNTTLTASQAAIHRHKLFGTGARYNSGSDTFGIWNHPEAAVSPISSLGPGSWETMIQVNDPWNQEPATGVSSYAGGGVPHNHSISAADNRPPYYALAYIMKL